MASQDTRCILCHGQLGGISNTDAFTIAIGERNRFWIHRKCGLLLLLALGGYEEEASKLLGEDNEIPGRVIRHKR